jgi:5-methylcytosine-specific restriction endonuclease McrA
VSYYRAMKPKRPPAPRDEAAPWYISLLTGGSRTCAKCARILPMNYYKPSYAGERGYSHVCFDCRELPRQSRFCANCEYEYPPGIQRCPRCRRERREEAKERRRSAHSYRKRITRARRLLVYKRDGWRCQLCGIMVFEDVPNCAPNKATLDHKVPVALGGTNAPDNLQTACGPCNGKKGGSV